MRRVYHIHSKRRRRLARNSGEHVHMRWYWLILAGFGGVLAFFLFIGMVGLLIYNSYATGLKPPEQMISESIEGPSVVRDRNGEQLYEFFDAASGLRDPVPLEDISPYLIAATIATEDATFYENPGINFQGTTRALLENLTPLGPGFLQGTGGSSITQQLVKNTYISPEDRYKRSIERKVKETVIAIELKANYDDDQIMEWYLNGTYYGNFAVGAEAAAQRYFGKRAAELTLAESALLAGIPQAPAFYIPTIEGNWERSVARQHNVLDLMLHHEEQVSQIVEVTPEMVEQAKQEEVSFQEHRFDIKAPHFVFYVEEQVIQMCEQGVIEPRPGSSCGTMLGRDALNITTTLDHGLQQVAEATVEEIVAANEARTRGSNGALVAISNPTGRILAYVGSRDYWREDIDGEVDIAQSRRSHGSTFKALTYLAAFQAGRTPSSTVSDTPLTIGQGPYAATVRNWNNSHMGQISIRRALAESVNVTAVRTVMDVGYEPVRALAQRMGIRDLRHDCGPTITLGACEHRLMDLVYAFSVLANNGVMRGIPTVHDLPDGSRPMDPVAIMRIEDAGGNVIFEMAPPHNARVVQPEHASMITDILSNDAVPWSRLDIGRPAAAKTGTGEEFKDSSLIGYTAHITAGVWIGNSDGTPMAQGTFSAAGSAPLWRTFMQRAHDYYGFPPSPLGSPGGAADPQPAQDDDDSETPPAPEPAETPAPTPAQAPTFRPQASDSGSGSSDSSGSSELSGSSEPSGSSGPQGQGPDGLGPPGHRERD